MTEQEEDKAEERHQLVLKWLEENGYKTWDVMEDDNGQEFVIMETENGNPGEEGYGFNKKRVYLDDVIYAKPKP